MGPTTTVVRNADEQDKRSFYGGGRHTWLAHDRDTGDGFLLFEDTVEAGKRTPLHTHPTSDETFYVLDGAILLHVAGAEHDLRTGGVAIVPRGVPHAFLVTAEGGARLLCLHTPGGGEAFYRNASEPTSTDEPPVEVDFARVQQSARATGTMHVVGPPPF
ncbi:MAG: Cupin 2, conserved barrel domain protein [Nocardioidaceae bacterium]|nr:Cupin 2, conserved barrel domain protein [Nocardioidaceae bacterium]